MSGEPTRKRVGGDDSEEDPPRKIAPDQLVEAESDQNDVVIIVGGHEFPCNKGSLSNCSNYFKSMFESSFAEKNKKEVEIGGIVTVEGFQMFLHVIEGDGTLTDEFVELALSLADFLESSVLEDRCIEFLTKESTYSKEEQFVLGDKYSSMNLITKLCSDIKDSYELHEVVPPNVDSLRSNTKTIVIQKSFELHGHRKPPAPPLPEQPEVEFETMIDEIIEQAAIADHHGEVLVQQAFLLSTHVGLDKTFAAMLPDVEEHIQEDPRIPILKHQLQNAVSQIERNSIRAQIQVLDYKRWYTAVELSVINQDEDDRWERFERSTTAKAIGNLQGFPVLINKSKRTENLAIENHPTGETTIDAIYRDITRDFEEKMIPEELPYRPSWVHAFSSIYRHWMQRSSRRLDNYEIPDGLRQIPKEINFEMMEHLILNMRKRFYNKELLLLHIQEQEAAANQNHEAVPIQEVAGQDGQE